LASVIVLPGTNRPAQLALLLPWPYFYARKDLLPIIFLSLCYLVFLAMKDAFRHQSDFEKESGIPEIARN
jgi:hypothetical protein